MGFAKQFKKYHKTLQVEIKLRDFQSRATNWIRLQPSRFTIEYTVRSRKGIGVNGVNLLLSLCKWQHIKLIVNEAQ